MTYPRDLATVEGEIKLAESDLMQATKDSEELSIKKAQLALEQLRSKLNALVDYTRSKTIKELRTAVQKGSDGGVVQAVGRSGGGGRGTHTEE